MLLGGAFAVCAAPCIGPVLAAILVLAGSSGTALQGAALLGVYSLGLAVPFLLTAVAFDRATTAFGWIRSHYMLVTALSGCVLIVMGTLILTGELTQLNVEAQKGLSNLGLDFLYKI